MIILDTIFTIAIISLIVGGILAIFRHQCSASYCDRPEMKYGLALVLLVGFEALLHAAIAEVGNWQCLLIGLFFISTGIWGVWMRLKFRNRFPSCREDSPQAS